MDQYGSPDSRRNRHKVRCPDTYPLTDHGQPVSQRRPEVPRSEVVVTCLPIFDKSSAKIQQKSDIRKHHIFRKNILDKQEKERFTAETPLALKISPVIRRVYFFNTPSFSNTNFLSRDIVLVPKMSEKIVSPLIIFIIERHLKIEL